MLLDSLAPLHLRPNLLILDLEELHLLAGVARVSANATASDARLAWCIGTSVLAAARILAICLSRLSSCSSLSVYLAGIYFRKRRNGTLAARGCACCGAALPTPHHHIQLLWCGSRSVCNAATQYFSLIEISTAASDSTARNGTCWSLSTSASLAFPANSFYFEVSLGLARSSGETASILEHGLVIRRHTIILSAKQVIHLLVMLLAMR